MISEIENVIKSFPKIEVEWYNGDREDVDKDIWNSAKLNLLKNKIAQQTRRGPGNIVYNGAVYYCAVHNEHGVDSPIIVLKGLNNKFAVFKHPLFDNYGFYITNWDEQ